MSNPARQPRTTCRRCSECADSEHHFMDNSCFGADDDDPDYLEDEHRNPTGNPYVCKHCDAVGDDCETCGGGGGHENENGVEIPCFDCGGGGIVVAEPKRYADLEF